MGVLGGLQKIGDRGLALYNIYDKKRLKITMKLKNENIKFVSYFVSYNIKL